VLYYLYCNEMWNQLDGLTGLLSQKSYLNRTLNLQPEDKMLIVLDLDNFKYINDTYGHQAGDQCLKVIAECLKKAYSRYGNCYRIGGDEFCVLFRKPEKEKYCREKFYWITEKIAAYAPRCLIRQCPDRGAGEHFRHKSARGREYVCE